MNVRVLPLILSCDVNLFIDHHTSVRPCIMFKTLKWVVATMSTFTTPRICVQFVDNLYFPTVAVHGKAVSLLRVSITLT